MAEGRNKLDALNRENEISELFRIVQSASIIIVGNMTIMKSLQLQLFPYLKIRWRMQTKYVVGWQKTLGKQQKNI